MNKSINNLEINIPYMVQIIMEAFEKSFYEIFIVGGCVRDSILNRKINDWDLCTNAKPNEIVMVCEKFGFRYVPTGIKHGTITIVINNQNFEITTYRNDGSYSDGRHPDEVSFTSSLKEDLARRDFTINALAYNSNTRLVDYFGGLEDIDNKVIRCVGDAEERLNEDNLRRFRAVRFASQLGFTIEDKTYNSLKASKNLLSILSVERIRDEIIKIIISHNASYGLRTLMNLNMLHNILPELEECKAFVLSDKYSEINMFEHLISIVDNVSPEEDLRFAALFYSFGKPNLSKEYCLLANSEFFLVNTEKVHKILKRLKIDNKTITKVENLIKFCNYKCDYSNSVNVKKFINMAGVKDLDDIFQLQYAIEKSYKNEFQSIDRITELQMMCNEIIKLRQPLSINDLKVNGHDLIKLGYKSGKNIGELLNTLLEYVLEKPELNTKEKLMHLLNNELRKL